MSDKQIILPGQVHGDSGLLLPEHVVARRAEHRERQERQRKMQEARDMVMRRAQGQLDVQMGSGPLTAQQHSENNFLFNVACGGANRKVRRQQRRAMGLLPSQTGIKWVKSHTPPDASTATTPGA